MGTNIPRPTKRPPTPEMNHPVPEENRTNCPNCCAVITGPICEYCGTVFDQSRTSRTIFRTTEGEEIIIPVYVGSDQIAEIVKQDPRFRSNYV